MRWLSSATWTSGEPVSPSVGGVLGDDLLLGLRVGTSRHAELLSVHVVARRAGACSPGHSRSAAVDGVSPVLGNRSRLPTSGSAPPIRAPTPQESPPCPGGGCAVHVDRERLRRPAGPARVGLGGPLRRRRGGPGPSAVVPVVGVLPLWVFRWISVSTSRQHPGRPGSHPGRCVERTHHAGCPARQSRRQATSAEPTTCSCSWPCCPARRARPGSAERARPQASPPYGRVRGCTHGASGWACATCARRSAASCSPSTRADGRRSPASAATPTTRCRAGTSAPRRWRSQDVHEDPDRLRRPVRARSATTQWDGDRLGRGARPGRRRTSPRAVNEHGRDALGDLPRQPQRAQPRLADARHRDGQVAPAPATSTAPPRSTSSPHQLVALPDVRPPAAAARSPTSTGPRTSWSSAPTRWPPTASLMTVPDFPSRLRDAEGARRPDGRLRPAPHRDRQGRRTSTTSSARAPTRSCCWRCCTCSSRRA